MKASEFVAAYAGKGLATWEREALNLIAEGDLAQPPTLEVPVQTPDGAHRGSFFAVGDYLAIGEPGDYMRMPLTPRNAQRVADLFSVQLPTRKMVDAIYAAAPAKLTMKGEVPNRGADLNQYLAHSRRVDAQIAAFGGPARPTAGGMKDVIVAKTIPYDDGPRPVRPGKVVIYGGIRPDGRVLQGKSDVHDEGYIDYSHGIRLVAPNMVVDGRETTIAEVLRDPVLSSMLSDEGTIERPRYGKPPPPPAGGEALTYAQMLARLRELG